MKAWLLAAGAVAAGCAGVRMDALPRDPDGGDRRIYSRDDPDARAAAAEAAGQDACDEARRGRWVMSLCADPQALRTGEAAVLRFQAATVGADDLLPLSGAAVSVTLRHKGGRQAPLVHADPSVSPVREVSPGLYEASAVFPAPGRWVVETVLTPPEGGATRLRFEVNVAPEARP